MSRTMAPRQVEALLEKQISVLGNLRNAGTRAPEFREWRQATLTLIERIWPDQPTRAQRFRRIPFSVASAKADDRVTREAFERGCAEGRRLLQLWLTEISTHGVRQETESPRLTEAVRAALEELHPPAADIRLPAPEETKQAKPAPKPAPKARKRKEKLSEMLGFVDTGVSPEVTERPAAPAGPIARTSPVLKAQPVTKAPPATRPSATPPAAPPAPLTLVTPPAAMRAPAPAAPQATGKPAPPAHTREPGAPEASPADFDDVLGHSIDTALERALHDADAVTGAAATRQAPRERPMVSYVARAFIGMAGDLDELGVPEGHRDRVRLALLDLAQHLDAGSVTWHLMRDAITLVMHYPPLGRQALPLLLPYLESAA